MVEGGVRHLLWVEGGGIEAAAPIFDCGPQRVVGEAQPDLDVAVRAAVADGVGGRLFDSQHKVVDGNLVGTVLGQVVADALAGAQQARRFGRKREVQARRGRTICGNLAAQTLPCGASGDLPASLQHTLWPDDHC